MLKKAGVDFINKGVEGKTWFEIIMGFHQIFIEKSFSWYVASVWEKLKQLLRYCYLSNVVPIDALRKLSRQIVPLPMQGSHLAGFLSSADLSFFSFISKGPKQNYSPLSKL